eukprot:Lithocolla_globosa_v1_NODE_9019_length_756_cov_12.828816.p1 type:complete len:181 gc:universal NODE_9019_length_756_cov_12.828816:168-710(+)
MYLKPEQRFRETRIGSGVYRDIVTGDLIRGNMKSIKRIAKHPGTRDVAVKLIKKAADPQSDILGKVDRVLRKPVVRDAFDDTISVAKGSKSLKSTLKKNISNAVDNEGMVRPNARAFLEETSMVPAALVKETKSRAKKELNLSELLGKSATKQRTKQHKGSGARVHGSGARIHGSGIAFI